MLHPAQSLLHIVALLAFSAVWMIGLGAGALLLVDAGTAGADPLDALGGAVLGLMTAAQIGGIAAFAALAARSLPGGASAAFPTATAPRWLVLAGIGGLVGCAVGSWIGGWLVDTTDPSSSVLVALERLLTEGSAVDRLSVALAIGVSAPLFEELVFRGYVWRALDVGFGRIGAWIGSTLLFAAYHLDPVQSLAVLPLAVFIGWLRLRSGSVVPALVAHLANNVAGIALAVGGA